MRVLLEYGKSGLEAELPDASVASVLSYQDASPLADPASALDEALQSPFGCPPLEEIARGRSDACILICDVTRPVPNELMLQPILAALERAGIPRERILILVATGLHRPNEGEELACMVGREIFERYRIENHFGQNQHEHAYLGDSPNGVPIWIDSRYLQADLKITVGLIEPHFMAGFSGGRKLICPGIAGIETIRRWHSPRFLEDPNADSAILDGNPVHAENTWIAQRVGCDFILNVVIDAKRRPLKFVAGDMEAAFIPGCQFVADLVTATVPAPVDIVVTSSAGYPLDTTFYQSVKGMVAALPIVKPGGTIILAASMSEGIGSPEFASLFEEHGDIESFMTRIMDDDYFVMDQWQLEKMAAVLRKAKVKVVTDGLAPEVLHGLFVEPASSVEAAVSDSLEQYGSHAKIAVIPKGPYVVARVADA